MLGEWESELRGSREGARGEREGGRRLVDWVPIRAGCGQDIFLLHDHVQCFV